MSAPAPDPAPLLAGELPAAGTEAERRGWYELVGLIRSLTPEECLEPGDDEQARWTVRDVVAHLGTWLAEVRVQIERIGAGTYAGHQVDLDSLDAAFLEAMGDQPWDVAWIQANAARNQMLEEWYRSGEPSDEAAWWLDRCAAAHIVAHLGPLRERTTVLIARRSADPGLGG